MPKVSIIVPCYNQAHYLSYSIGSILSQTFRDWEAIIVNDGSSDDTVKQASEFRDNRIQRIDQRNAGLASARNAGIRAAEGAYLSFLDADDEWEPRFLEASMVVAATENADVTIAQAVFIDQEGFALPIAPNYTAAMPDVGRQLLQGGFFPVHAALVRTDLVRTAGMFDEALTSLEDWDLWLRLAASGASFAYVAAPLARYRVSPGSMSTNASVMHNNRIAVIAKHFGPPTGDYENWPEKKRQAFAFAYRASALGYVQCGDSDSAWSWLAQAGRVWPPILTRLDTVYELALGDQQRGIRGDARKIDIRSNGSELIARLNILFNEASAPVQEGRAVTLSNAHLALGMLADQAGDWSLARRYLLHALVACPRLGINPFFFRRLAKLTVGQRVGRIARRAIRQDN